MVVYSARRSITLTGEFAALACRIAFERYFGGTTSKKSVVSAVVLNMSKSQVDFGD